MIDPDFHEAVAVELANALFADSRIPLGESLPKLRAAVARENTRLGPTPGECDTLVMGDEETGEVPDYLKEKYPHINETLNGFF